MSRALAAGLLLWLVSASAPSLGASVAAGGYHGQALTNEGLLLTWGQNTTGQLGDGTTASRSFPVRALSDVREMAAGWWHGAAITSDGALWTWGYNVFGQLGDGSTSNRLLPVRVLSGVRAVAAGEAHTLAIKTDGTLWAWGYNTSGQLGDGSTTHRLAPVQVMTDVRAVVAGRERSLAIRNDGSLWAWGNNASGSLGDGTTTNRLVPVQVLGNVATAAAGGEHTLALRADGTVWAWGANFTGQLGNGGTTNQLAPVHMLSGAVAIAAGHRHSAAVRSDGTLWSWGWNFYGQLGDGTTTARLAPVSVLAGAQGVAAGFAHTVAQKSDGTRWAWGLNTDGQLGDGGTVSRAAPVAVLSGVQTIAAGTLHALAIKSDRSLWAWGDNRFGQLGDGSAVSRPAPVQVLSNVQSIAANGYFSLAVTADGVLRSWGSNGLGQLGNGTTTDSPIPIQVMTGAQAVAAGGVHAVALKADGTVWTWGSNKYGQLGNGTTTDRSTPVQVLTGVRAIAAGSSHSLAIRTDGSLWAWGANFSGALGDGTAQNRLLPVRVLDGVKAAAGGIRHTLALRNDDSVWAWGADAALNRGQSSVPAPVLAGAKAIAASFYRSMAVKADGTVWSWGNATAGALGPGISGGVLAVPAANPYLRGAAAVAAGGDTAFALLADGRVFAWGDNAGQQLGLARSTQNPTPMPVRDPLAAYAGADLVAEYFNATIRNGAGTPGIGHYFITAAAAEMASIDAGGSGPGWTRTGRTFRAWNDPAKAPAGAVGVCRFYAGGPNSHFYTANAAECQSLRNMNPANNPRLGWAYEGIAFYTVLPVGNSCPAGYFPLYRSYNNRFDPDPARNDGNHRITPSYNDYRRSIAFFGYADEGIAFCSPAGAGPGGDLQATYGYPGATVRSGDALTAEFVFNNNGAGRADGGSVYVALPAEVADWHVVCTSRHGASCPASLQPDLLRTGQGIANWPAGGGLILTATGTAPQVAAGGDATLNYAVTVAAASGSPDANAANDTPPVAQTVIKSAAACHFVPNPSAVALGAAAQAGQVSLFAGDGCGWTAQSSAAWLAVEPAGGSGDAVLTLTPQANPDPASRSATIIAGGQAIQVTQSGLVCSYVLSPATLALDAGARIAAITLKVAAGCAWTAQSSAPWLGIAPASGNGDGTLTLTAQANAGADARTGTIAVGGQTLQVAQAGAVVAAPACSYALATSALSLGAAAQNVSVALTASAGCAWTAASDVPWLVPAPDHGSGSGTILLAAAANPATSARSGIVTIGGQALQVAQAGITQAVAPVPVNPCATLTLPRTGDQIPGTGLSGATTFVVQADPQCAWTAQSDASWLTLTAGGSGTGNGAVSYFVQPNPSVAFRSAAIAVGPGTFTVDQFGQDTAGLGTNDGGGDGGGGGGDGGSSGGDSG